MPPGWPMLLWCLLGIPEDFCSSSFYHTTINNTEKETQLTWNWAEQQYDTGSRVAPCPLCSSGYTGIKSSILQFESLRKVIWETAAMRGRGGRGCGADNPHCDAVGLQPVRRRSQGHTGCWEFFKKDLYLRNLLSSCHSCSSPRTNQPKHSSPL